MKINTRSGTFHLFSGFLEQHFACYSRFVAAIDLIMLRFETGVRNPAPHDIFNILRDEQDSFPKFDDEILYSMIFHGIGRIPAKVN